MFSLGKRRNGPKKGRRRDLLPPYTLLIVLLLLFSFMDLFAADVTDKSFESYVDYILYTGTKIILQQHQHYLAKDSVRGAGMTGGEGESRLTRIVTSAVDTLVGITHARVVEMDGQVEELRAKQMRATAAGKNPGVVAYFSRRAANDLTKESLLLSRLILGMMDDRRASPVVSEQQPTEVQQISPHASTTNTSYPPFNRKFHVLLYTAIEAFFKQLVKMEEDLPPSKGEEGKEVVANVAKALAATLQASAVEMACMVKKLRKTHIPYPLILNTEMLSGETALINETIVDLTLQEARITRLAGEILEYVAEWGPARSTLDGAENKAQAFLDRQKKRGETYKMPKKSADELAQLLDEAENHYDMLKAKINLLYAELIPLQLEEELHHYKMDKEEEEEEEEEQMKLSGLKEKEEAMEERLANVEHLYEEVGYFIIQSELHQKREREMEELRLQHNLQEQKNRSASSTKFD